MKSVKSASRKSSPKLVGATKAKKTPKLVGATKSADAGVPFRDLSAADRQRIASTIVGGLRRVGAFARIRRNGYEVVKGPGQQNRPWVAAETGGEESVLNQSERNRLITMARNIARNSEQLEGILHQFEINVVGTDGGKAVFSFGPGLENEERIMRESFADWARACEFFDDFSLQRLLKLALRTQIMGGNVVLVFDDDLVEDSGKIIAFEPDCVGNMPDEDFARLFPAYRQTQGIIKTVNSRTIGVIVSWSQRGQSVYQTHDQSGRIAAWPLIKPAGLDWQFSPFVIHRSAGRFNSSLGYTGLWSALATLQDLSDLQTYEVQAAKKNSQTIGQVTQQADEPEPNLAAELDPDVVAPIAADDAANAAAAAAEEQIPLDLDEMDAAGCVYDVLPPGCKYELLDTRHPNSNMPEFIRWLQGSSAWSKGLAAVYAHGKADSSYTAAMAEMLMTQKSFDDEWLSLERGILDWVIPHWFAWAVRHGQIPADVISRLPDHWMRSCVKWQRPQKHAINPVDEQNALNSGLRNGTILYRDKYGADWKHHLDEFFEEVAYFQERGQLHPKFETVAGAIVTPENQEGDSK